jgi:beta-glucosidase
MWGASTAAHQIEGGTLNQWSEWELAHASELAKIAKQRLGWLTNWEDIKAQATAPENYVSGRSVDHYKRYEADFDLLEQLNMNAYRFGIEWSRLEPREGAWNIEALEHYRQYIKSLRGRNIEPIITLWHWTVPVWFAAKGGFAKRANIKYFERYVQRIAQEYGADLKYVITINEPNVYATFSYQQGEWPPQTKSIWQALWVYNNLKLAHKRVYRILKRARPNLQVGMAQNFSCNLPKNPISRIDRLFATIGNYSWNWWFLDRTKRHQDFIGFNFYHTVYWSSFRQENPDKPVNDVGWYMEPGKLYDLLMWTDKRYRRPIIITENGVADAKDTYRRWWLEQTIVAMQKALKDGVQLRGYLHWSLLDNFEWAYGWWPQFGLVHVDRARGMRRTIRPSAEWFGAYIAQANSERKVNGKR